VVAEEHPDRTSGNSALPPRRPTIYDVARETGVSTSTVSRALSRPERVNATTRAHVLTVAERLGYAADPAVRSIGAGRTKTVALLVPDITNPYFFGIIRGGNREASAAGITLVLAETEESPDLEIRHAERLKQNVDGFVLASSRVPEENIQALAEHHKLVMLNREVDGLSSVIVDPYDGSRQIVEHLASLGHRSLAYLAGPLTSWLGARRWRALSAAAQSLGLTARRLGPFQPAVISGPAAADAGVGSGATALVAHNDLLAIGMLQRLAERGVRVPEQVSVVGYDDIFGADFCSPPLTTLAGPHEKAGRAAVDLLVAALETRDAAASVRRVTLPSHLVIRASTAAAAPRA
jgi:DNA-binding LacI/PurR family transcriptional regulator